MSNVEYIAGGATQNSIRVAQWMLQSPGATTYMGCVGDDDFAKKMTDTASKDGVQVSGGGTSRDADMITGHLGHTRIHPMTLSSPCAGSVAQQCRTMPPQIS